VRRAGEGHLHLGTQALSDPRRAGDRQSASPPGELTVEDQIGQPAEVVAVEVRGQDRVDIARVKAEAAQRQERRCSAVEEELEVTGT
jgi:hypothetical protein